MEFVKPSPDFAKGGIIDNSQPEIIVDLRVNNVKQIYSDKIRRRSKFDKLYPAIAVADTKN